MKRTLFNVVMILVLVLSLSTAVFAQEEGPPPDRSENREVPESVQALKLDVPLELSGIDRSVLDRSLLGAEGLQQVIVQLKSPSLAETGLTSDAAQSKHVKKLKSEQSKFIGRAKKVGAKETASVQRILNAVFLEVDAAALVDLVRDPDVLRIAPVGTYELDLSETVPYIGATAVQNLGFDGSGIRVAVLDTGIDYTHAALGGSGDPADYAANDGTIIEPGTFPTAKVVGGYDFVGSSWDGSISSPPESPDPDPLDDGPGGGHGTHVSHIIGGVGGVAPGVDLYAVKVCSSISTACSGIALIQGMEFAVDPNGDGKVKDRVDIVNMSLGSLYGQPFDDDLSTAVDNATKLGILTVAAAGNGFDKPYVTDTPGSAETALSVAQTEVPSAILVDMEIVEPMSLAGFYEAIFQPWSVPLTTAIQAPLLYGDGAGGNLNGCSPFTTDLTGFAVLVDRGDCNFTLKISNISQAGGEIGIIGLTAPGAPFAGGDGGDRPIDIPGYMISKDDADTLQSGLPDTVVRFDPAAGTLLVGTMVGSSSRGPQNEDTTLIKPEIGAPGASVSAIAGTGIGEGPFGGTSGATPMVSGAAALILEGFGGTKSTGNGTPPGNAIGHGLSPLEVKALLMNNADTDIINDALIGKLAPITRIGGGEVRVDRALSAPVAAWDNDVASGALSFGFVDVADNKVTLTKTVRIRNFDNTKHTYTVKPTFRFDNDVINGAVTVSAPSKVVVKPGLGRDTLFKVTLTIDGAKLRDNYMNSGSQGANPEVLTLNEYDGYLILDDGLHPIHLAWQVLPRKDARVVPDTTDIVPSSFPQVIGLNNTGVGTAQNDAYSLLAVSPDIPEGGRGEGSPTPDIRAVGINTFPVPAGYCSADPSFLWAFAINTWERQQHLVPVVHNIDLDIDQDTIFDYEVFNFDTSFSGSLSDGRQLTWVVNLATGDASAFFYAEHSMNTGNTALYICAEQVGLTGTDMLSTNVDMSVYTQDWYYGGPGDIVDGLTVTPLGEQHYGVPNDVPGNTYDSAGLALFDYGPWPGNTPELGLMLFTNGDRGTGVHGGATQDTEALLFMAP